MEWGLILMSKAGVNISYTNEFMLGAMTNRGKIRESLYFSGVEQLEILLDMDLMIEEANLTEKQAQVVDLYYFNQYTKEEVSQRLGISQQAVLDHLKKVKNKIEKVLERWRGLDDKQQNN